MPPESPEHLSIAEQSKVDAAASEKGRVLLLEDDPSFREIVSDFLVEMGYTVVAVQNGGEGVRQVLASDFTMILCDMAMPTLPGHVFYRAVEQIRPELCPRFVFMTGYRGDALANEFIRNVNGFVLQKPFPLKNLADSIALAEVRGTFRSVFEGAPTDPVLSGDRRPAGDFQADGIPCPDESALAQHVERILPCPQIVLSSGTPSGSVRVTEPEPPASRGSPAFMLAGLALVLVLVAGLWRPYWGARERVDAASASRQVLDAELAAVSRNLQEAVAARSKTEVAQRQLAGVSADRSEPRWSPALRSIVACAGLGIQLREVRAREKFGDAKMWTLLVGGISTGSAPRTAADDFRSKLQRELERVFQGGVTIRLERFEELSDLPSVPPGDRRGAFTIVATIGLAGKTTPEREDGA